MKLLSVALVLSVLSAAVASPVDTTHAVAREVDDSLEIRTELDLDERDLDLDLDERDLDVDLDERDIDELELDSRDLDELELDPRDTLSKRKDGHGLANPERDGDKVALKCRSGPSTKYSENRTWKQGESLTIKCQTTGQKIGGNGIWNKVNRIWPFDDCYVADYYTKTGKTWIDGVPRC